MSRYSRLAWALVRAKENKEITTITYKDRGIMIQGDFNQPYSLGFFVYSLNGTSISHIKGIDNIKRLEKFVIKNYPLKEA